MSSQAGRVARHIAGIPRSGIRDYFDLVMTMDDVVSLGVGEPDFSTPWHIREAAIYALEQGRTSYTSNAGMPRLRRAIAEYLEREFGVVYRPEDQILVTVGVSEALDLALRALIDPGDEVVFCQPSYVSYHPGIVSVHGVPRPIACGVEDGFAPTPEAIRAAITPRTRLLILNYPSNPTGETLDRTRLSAIAALAREHDLLVLSDEIYGELTYEEEHVSLATLPGMAERTVLLHGLSKTYAMTGFRLGYACGPPPVIEAMLRIHQYAMLCASIISQDAAVEALCRGREAAESMKEEYRMRRDFVVGSFNRMGLACHLPRGAFYAFPSIAATGLSSGEFSTRLLREQRVACVPGDAFGASGEGFLRCCFATGFEQLELAMERMERFMRSLGRPVAGRPPR